MEGSCYDDSMFVSWVRAKFALRVMSYTVTDLGDYLLKETTASSSSAATFDHSGPAVYRTSSS